MVGVSRLMCISPSENILSILDEVRAIVDPFRSSAFFFVGEDSSDLKSARCREGEVIFHFNTSFSGLTLSRVRKFLAVPFITSFVSPTSAFNLLTKRSLFTNLSVPSQSDNNRLRGTYLIDALEILTYPLMFDAVL